MPIPIVYRNHGETAIATYNYTDVANGQGIIEWDCFQANDTSTNSFHLSDNPLGTYSTSVASYTNGSATVTFTFDASSFNGNRTVQGKAFFLATHAVNSASSGNNLFVVTIKKYDGTNTTTIGTGTSSTITSTGTLQTTTELIPITLTKTTFKRGDVLRIVVDFTYVTTSGTTRHYLAFDPLDRDYTNSGNTITAATNPTYMKCAIPFRIDL